ncbi:MAG: hypothetical protein EAZ41_04615 [Sphingobacteriia bacterium]|nr:MAG: hypothetical protein EAZ41_04615 [Sphingobacteriia bacterium]
MVGILFRFIDSSELEFKENGYEVFTGSRLKVLRTAFEESASSGRHGTDINVGIMVQSPENKLISSKTSVIGILTFTAFLNVGMLLTNSERAKELRSAILNIVIDFLNKRIGESTKFINQREEDFVPSALREFNYRKESTNALNAYIIDGKIAIGYK